MGEPHGLVVRPATAEDAPALAVFVRALGLFPRFDSERMEATSARMSRHLDMCLADDSHLVLLAEIEGRPAGFASVHWLPYLILLGPEGYLSELFVAPEHRGTGMGSALLEAVVQAGRDRGCSRLMLEAVKTRESYVRGFYTKRGWEERPDMANFVYRFEPHP